MPQASVIANAQGILGTLSEYKKMNESHTSDSRQLHNLCWHAGTCTCPEICQAAVGTSSCPGHARGRWPWQRMWIQTQKRHKRNWWLSSTPPGPICQPGAADTSRWSAHDTKMLLKHIQVFHHSSAAAHSCYRSAHLWYTSRHLCHSSSPPPRCSPRAQLGGCPQPQDPAPPAGSGSVFGAGGGLWSSAWCLPAQWGPAEAHGGRPQSRPAGWDRRDGAGCTLTPHNSQNLPPAATGPPGCSSRHSQHPLMAPCHCWDTHTLWMNSW